MTTVMKTDEELVAEFEKEVKAAKEQSKSFDHFWLRLTEDGQKAIIHPLLNFPQMTLTKLPYHEKFDRTAKRWVADNVCAAPFGKPCKLCQQAEANNDKDLKASPRVFLPVYVHGIWNTDSMGEFVAVTEKDDAGVAQSIKGPRYLKMRPTSDLCGQIHTKYKEAQDDRILSSDFEYVRSGKTKTDTEYSLIRRKKVLPMPDTIRPYSVEKVISDVRLHREEQAVEVPDPFEPVADGQPLPTPAEEQAQQFTVNELLEMKKPTEKQLTSIVSLCKLLDKSYVEPLSFGQAANMLRNLREEYNASLAEA